MKCNALCMKCCVIGCQSKSYGVNLNSFVIEDDIAVIVIMCISKQHKTVQHIWLVDIFEIRTDAVGYAANDIKIINLTLLLF